MTIRSNRFSDSFRRAITIYSENRCGIPIKLALHKALARCKCFLEQVAQMTKTQGSGSSQWRSKLWLLLAMDSSSSVRPVESTPNPFAAFAFSPETKRKESRYFAFETVLPPLQRLDQFSNLTTSTHHSGLEHNLPVLYTNDPKFVYLWLSDNVPSGGCTLGFDVESVPVTPWTKGKVAYIGPATVQLATTKSALVVHLTRPSGVSSRACAPILEAVLQDELFVKAGVGCDQDMMDLFRCWGGSLEARSRFDLGSVRLSRETSTPGLKSLAEKILGLDLIKSRRLAMSNWGQVPLTEAQLAYCARDAWVGAAITAKLAENNPDVFGHAALVSMLKSQRPLRDLELRARERKIAKNELTGLLAPYRDAEHRQQPFSDICSQLPVEVRHRVNHLMELLKSSAPEKQAIYHVDTLAFQRHDA